MQIDVRPMLSSDPDKVSIIEISVFSDPWKTCDYEDMLQSRNHSVLCAWDESSKLLGYAAVGYVAGESEILRIATSPEARRCGIGRALLTRMIEERKAAGDEIMFLEVRSQNTPAVSLYSSVGFSVYAMRKGYYKAPSDDALMMSLDLKKTDTL